MYTSVSDPVNNITGESYVDETDLQLPGPIPLALRRNYSSQNLADNQFGPGWKFSIMPYLSVSRRRHQYLCRRHGRVCLGLCPDQHQQQRLAADSLPPIRSWTTTPRRAWAAWPTACATGSSSRVNGSVTNYTLYGADGSVRTFQVMSFNNGVVNQTRPYLLQWTDNRGNYYTFAYGTNASQPDFGQVRRIQCSNGNYLGFYFDIYGHIIEAYSETGAG